MIRGENHIKAEKDKITLSILYSYTGKIKVKNDVHFSRFTKMKEEMKEAWVKNS